MKPLYFFTWIFCFTSLFCTEPTFEWEKSPRGNQPKSNQLQPGPNIGMDPFSRFDAMRQKMQDIQMRLFQDPFFWRMPGNQTGLPPMSQVQIREMKDFLLVEVPVVAGENPDSYDFVVQGNFLSISKKEEQNVEEESSGHTRKMISFSQSTSALSLPVAVEPEFSRQNHKDKILITLKKL
ncbi:MAG: hypothetical protein H3C47_09385 [Candidatus Cloacimonetes bacterium]|nr:hypothetical protein [Candidatus Cloacimonadota bacterium]